MNKKQGILTLIALVLSSVSQGSPRELGDLVHGSLMNNQNTGVEQRIELQQKLADKNCYTGRVDGKLGRQSNAAIERFKAANQIRPADLAWIYEFEEALFEAGSNCLDQSASLNDFQPDNSTNRRTKYQLEGFEKRNLQLEARPEIKPTAAIPEIVNTQNSDIEAKLKRQSDYINKIEVKLDNLILSLIGVLVTILLALFGGAWKYSSSIHKLAKKSIKEEIEQYGDLKKAFLKKSDLSDIESNLVSMKKMFHGLREALNSSA